jgi:hypothetical protein
MSPSVCLGVPLEAELKTKFKEICKVKGYKMSLFYARLLRLYLADPARIELMMQEQENNI